jgi:hypothetical protein
MWQTHLLKSKEVTEKMLKANEKMVTLNRAGNPLWRWDTNYLAGNNRCEDAHAVDIFSADELPFLITDPAQTGQVDEPLETSGKPFWERWYNVKTRIRGDHRLVQSKAGNGSKDIVMSSVFDGHLGTHILSDLLSKTLHATIARAIGIWERDGGSKLQGEERIAAISKVISDT